MKPSLAELGTDLLVTTRRQRWIALARPYLGMLDQTRTLRGRVIPAVFLELTYHLEHHLYPQVPSHHLARLSRRLDPFLTRSGVVPRRVI